MAPFVGLVAWSLPLFHVRIPDFVVAAIAIAAWLLIAAAVQQRMLDDWRSEYEVNLNEITQRTAVPPNVRVDKR